MNALGLLRTALAAAEPHTDKSIEEAIANACQPYFSDHSLGADIDELDVTENSVMLDISTRFSANDGEDGVIHANFRYEKGALTVNIADTDVLRNKKMPMPTAAIWASLVRVVLAFLERLLVTECKRINAEIKSVETEFKSGLSKLFKVPVTRSPLTMFVSWHPAGTDNGGA